MLSSNLFEIGIYSTLTKQSFSKNIFLSNNISNLCNTYFASILIGLITLVKHTIKLSLHSFVSIHFREDM